MIWFYGKIRLSRGEVSVGKLRVRKIKSFVKFDTIGIYKIFKIFNGNFEILRYFFIILCISSSSVLKVKQFHLRSLHLPLLH